MSDQLAIGFRPGKYTCSICDQDYFGLDCDHVKGMRYDAGLCFVRLTGVKIYEVSLVAGEGFGHGEILSEGVSPWNTVIETTLYIFCLAGFLICLYFAVAHFAVVAGWFNITLYPADHREDSIVYFTLSILGAECFGNLLKDWKEPRSGGEKI